MLRVMGFKILIFLSLWFSLHSFAVGESFGSYSGLLEHKNIGKNQFVKLDLIFSRGADNKFQLRGILTLFFGDFSSDEYISYHYHNVSYNLLTGDMVFEQPDQDLVLIGSLNDRGEFSGGIKSSTSGAVGHLLLRKTPEELNHKNFLKSVSGQYHGFCDGKKTKMLLSTLKSTGDTLRLGNPFGSYMITGKIGDNTSFQENENDTRFHVTDLVYSGTYDFFNGNLKIVTRRTSYQCSIDDFDLTCGKCRFKKKATDPDLGHQSVPKTSTPFFALDIENSQQQVPESISGQYRGYLHHERLDTYQSVDLSLKAFQDPESENDSTLRISAVAKLIFGDFESLEFIPYRFPATEINVLNKTFVLEGMEDDIDPILHIEQLRNGEIRGTWYSILYGRVGTFLLKKNVIDPLPKSMKLYQPIGGKYESDDLEMLITTRLDAAPVNTENPFFPRIFSGYFWYKAGFAARLDIVDGSFDFYTGKIGLFVESDRRIATGSNTAHLDELYLIWPPKVLTPPYSDRRFKQFKRIENE